MSTDTAPLLIATALLLAIAWTRPFYAIGFLAVGSIPYYAALHLVGQSPSAELTGGLFGGVGVAGLARLAAELTRFRQLVTSRYLLLFLCFVLVWFARWWLDPPVTWRAHQMTAFAARAQVLMIVYCCLPFLCGLMMSSRQEMRQLLVATSHIGVLGVLIMLGYWAAGAPHLGSRWLNKWEPIPSLTGIVISLELGLTALALVVTEAGTTRSRLARWLVVAGVLAIQVRVGQRGPFVFLLAAIVAALGMGARGSFVRLGAAAGALAGAVAALSIELSDRLGDSRATDIAGYTAEGNQDRLAILKTAVELFLERPVLGWGGSLVGTPLAGDVWDYAHMMLLDLPLETGLLGATPFFALVFFAGRDAGRVWLAHPELRSQLKWVLVPLLFLFLEAQVSGHISSHKHTWLFLGALCVLTRWMSHQQLSQPPPLHSRDFGAASA